MNAIDYQTNGNGHANGNGKIFELHKATDPDTLAILDARTRALADPRLKRSAALFCKILDMALNPKFFKPCKGVVTVSDPYLAKNFNVSDRTIYTWKMQIVQAGYFWLSKKFVPNMWPLTTYNISALHKPTDEQRTDDLGTYGGESVRSAPASPGQGARRPGQPGLPLPGSGKPRPKSKSEDLREISGETGKTLRARAEENFG
jgi:hypothetical protein